MLNLWQNTNDSRGLTKQTAWQLFTFEDFVNDKENIVIIISSSNSNISSSSSNR